MKVGSWALLAYLCWSSPVWSLGPRADVPWGVVSDLVFYSFVSVGSRGLASSALWHVHPLADVMALSTVSLHRSEQNVRAPFWQELRQAWCAGRQTLCPPDPAVLAAPPSSFCGHPRRCWWGVASCEAISQRFIQGGRQRPSLPLSLTTGPPSLPLASVPVTSLSPVLFRAILCPASWRGIWTR